MHQTSGPGESQTIAAQDELCTVVFYLLQAFMWWLSIKTKW